MERPHRNRLIQAILIIGLLIVFALAAPSCRSAQPILAGSDSHTEIKVNRYTVTVIDTITWHLPKIWKEIHTRDSMVTLENEYAFATARLLPDGTLSLVLETKDQDIHFPVAVNEQHVDSSYVSSNSETHIEYRDKPLSRWQQFKIDTGGLTITILAAALAYQAVRHRKHIRSWFHKLIRFLVGVGRQ